MFLYALNVYGLTLKKNDQQNTTLLEIKGRAVKAKDKPLETEENISEPGIQEDKVRYHYR